MNIIGAPGGRLRKKGGRAARAESGLASGAAKGAGKISGRAALQHHHDQSSRKQTQMRKISSNNGTFRTNEEVHFSDGMR